MLDKMLMKPSKTLTILYAVLSLNAVSSEISSPEKGFRVPVESVIKNFSLMNLTPTTELITRHILKTNFRVPLSEAIEISKIIIEVSSCIQIDPWILTGLIQKESTFNKYAISPTGAAGLTQFTSIGFKEVNDQLGLRGRAGAPVAVTLYFSNKIKNCIDPSWTDLWNRVDVKEDNAEFYNLLKEEVKKDITSSIVYGAILLKTYLAFVHSSNTFEALPLKTSEIYFRALQIYNGEEGDAKIKYAKNIFQNLKTIYPDEVNFPLNDFKY